MSVIFSDTRPVRTASLSVFGESVARCRETVASRTRGLTVLLRDLAALIHRDTATGIQEVQHDIILFYKINKGFTIMTLHITIKTHLTTMNEQ